MASSWLRYAEFVVWVVVVFAAAVAVLAAPSFALGSGLLSLKHALFVLGFVLFGFASLGLQPKRPHRDRKYVTADTDSDLWFEERIQSLPPFAERPLPLDLRISRNAKLFVVSLLMLGLSAALEYVLGVRPG